jgi:hypothetical protein
MEDPDPVFEAPPAGPVRRYWLCLRCGASFERQEERDTHASACGAEGSTGGPGEESMDWTDAMDDQLRELWSQGISAEEIAERLGVGRAGRVYYRRTVLMERRRWPKRLDQAREARRLELGGTAAAIQGEPTNGGPLRTTTGYVRIGDLADVGPGGQEVAGGLPDDVLEPASQAATSVVPVAAGVAPAVAGAETQTAALVRLYRDGRPISAIAAALGLADAASVWARIREMRERGTWERAWDMERGERSQATNARRTGAPEAEPASRSPRQHEAGDVAVVDLYWQARIGLIEAKRLFSLFSLHVPVLAEGRFDVWIRIARADEASAVPAWQPLTAFSPDGGEGRG